MRKKISVGTLVQQNKSIPSTELDGEVGMMNPHKGKYYTSDEIGSRIWDIAKDKVSVEGIVNILITEYDVDRETCQAHVIEYITELVKEELFVIQ